MVDATACSEDVDTQGWPWNDDQAWTHAVAPYTIYEGVGRGEDGTADRDVARQGVRIHQNAHIGRRSKKESGSASKRYQQKRRKVREYNERDGDRKRPSKNTSTTRHVVA